MKITDLHPFDPITYLNDEEDVMGYLHSVIEENRPKATAAALHDVARARRRLHLTAPFDPVDYLHNEAQITAYLQVAAEQAAEYGDSSILTDAIRTAARARGMADLAQVTGIPRESLDNTLQETARLGKILAALGVNIALTPKSP